MRSKLSTRKATAVLGCAMVIASLTALGCTEPAALRSRPAFQSRLLAQASPDECLAGIGEPYPTGPPCAAPAQEKINEAYVWGLTEEAGKYFFGTAPNVHCLVQGGFLSATGPQQVPSWVCEFGESQMAQLGVPAMVGDWRPPRAYRYDRAEESLAEITPSSHLFTLTLGIRSAGSLGGAVFLAGPDLLQRGINMFAWNAETGLYIGSKLFKEYTNIRQWLAHEGVLYAAVGKRGGGGRVLRWRGDLADPWQFEEVGNLDGDGANLSIYHSEQGTHLAVTTWPNILGGGPPSAAALWISPPLPPLDTSDRGLTAADADGWTRAWQITDYEPDPIIGAVLGGGAVAYFDGWLYWGTMVVPGLAPAVYALIPGGPLGAEATGASALGLVINTWRAIAIFRGRNLETDEPEIELLYGETSLPAYDFAAGQWERRPNKMGVAPLYGSSGFGNDYNNYTWIAGVAHGRLLIGTMDWSYLVDAGLLAGLADVLFGSELAGGLSSFMAGGMEIGKKPPHLLSFVRGHGADLWRFDSSDEPAVPENVRGLSNRYNYGFRSIIAQEDLLVIGSANPMNLETGGGRHGGWELLELAPR